MGTLILDSNILIYLNSDKVDLGERIKSILLKATEEYSEIVISSISFFEVLKGVAFEKLALFYNTLESFSTIDVDREVCRRAANIQRVYSENKISDKQCSTEDLLIAGSATILPADIFTANGNDYPRPFFREIGHWSIEYKHGDRCVTQHVVSLRPDIDTIRSIYLSITS